MIMAKNSIERTGKFYTGDRSNLLTNDDLLLDNAIDKKKKQKEEDEVKKLLLEAQQTKQKELMEKMATLEILPHHNRVFILPYPSNPYRKVISNNGILLPDGDFFNPDKGEFDKLEQNTVCGKIMEVGKNCTDVKVGDDVYYDKRTTWPIPFLGLGYISTSEPQLLAILGEGLKQRFNMNE